MLRIFVRLTLESLGTSVADSSLATILSTPTKGLIARLKTPYSIAAITLDTAETSVLRC
jgi:hypothetical protein